jgi:uncharacterized protein DUF1905/bacteriocin resistance YdeI/OmpD-like protein
MCRSTARKRRLTRRRAQVLCRIIDCGSCAIITERCRACAFLCRADPNIQRQSVCVRERRTRQGIKPGWRKPLPVLIRINGKPTEQPWRINMMPIGKGDFYLYLHGDVRRASDTKVGDNVRVQVRFDAAYRNGPMHPMPSWFRVPLSKNAKAKTAWDGLIPSRKKEVLRYFSWLKSPDACARNVARALHVLSGKKGRFMGRPW